MNPQKIIEKYISDQGEVIEEFAWVSGKFIVQSDKALRCGYIKAGQVEIQHTWYAGSLNFPKP